MGLGRVAAAKKFNEENKRGGRKWLSIGDGESVIIRPLEEGDEFKDCFVHRVPFEREGKTQHIDVPCLDQKNKGVPCPGCKDDIERRYKFYLNCIVRDHEDEDSDEKADTVMIWSGGITVATRLDKLQAKNKGLMGLDLEVERDGVKKKTKYTIDVESKSELSTDDKKLAEKKADLTRYITPPEFDDFYTPPWERDNDDDEGGVAGSSKSANPFGKKKRGAVAVDEDDEDADQASTKIKTRIKSAGKTKTTRVRRR
jgi:hypothetical protein